MFALKRTSAPGAAVRKAADLPDAHLGRKLSVRGLLETEGKLFVHGAIIGRINAQTLIICEDGAVDGDVVANEVCIKGYFTGRVFARTVVIEPTAEIHGRIFHTSVTVARGARVDPEARMPWRPPSYFETLVQLPET